MDADVGATDTLYLPRHLRHLTHARTVRDHDQGGRRTLPRELRVRIQQGGDVPTLPRTPPQAGALHVVTIPLARRRLRGPPIQDMVLLLFPCLESIATMGHLSRRLRHPMHHHLRSLSKARRLRYLVTPFRPGYQLAFPNPLLICPWRQLILILSPCTIHLDPPTTPMGQHTVLLLTPVPVLVPVLVLRDACAGAPLALLRPLVQAVRGLMSTLLAVLLPLRRPLQDAILTHPGRDHLPDVVEPEGFVVEVGAPAIVPIPVIMVGATGEGIMSIVLLDPGHPPTKIPVPAVVRGFWSAVPEEKRLRISTDRAPLQCFPHLTPIGHILMFVRDPLHQHTYPVLRHTVPIAPDRALLEEVLDRALREEVLDHALDHALLGVLGHDAFFVEDAPPAVPGSQGVVLQHHVLVAAPQEKLLFGARQEVGKAGAQVLQEQGEMGALAHQLGVP